MDRASPSLQYCTSGRPRSLFKPREKEKTSLPRVHRLGKLPSDYDVGGIYNAPLFTIVECNSVGVALSAGKIVTKSTKTAQRSVTKAGRYY